jgi:hypothetical protein
MLYKGEKFLEEHYNGVTLFKQPYSFLGSKLYPGVSSSSKAVNSNKKGHFRIFKNFGSKFKLKSLIFPDPLIFEYPRLRAKLKELVVKNNYDIIVGSSVPYTTLMLAGFVRKINEDIKWIHDIGDPLYPSMNGYKVRSKLACYFERYYTKSVNVLVVNNGPTKAYYIARYNNFNENNIVIIPQGCDLQEKPAEIPNRSDDIIRIIYAGTFHDILRKPFSVYKAVGDMGNLIKLDLYGLIPEKHQPGEKYDNIVYRGSAVHEHILEQYSKSDIILIIDNSIGIQTPGKVVEVIGAYKPILFVYENENSPTLEYLRNVPYAFSCRNESNEIKLKIEEIITKIKRNEVLYDFSIQNLSWRERASEYKNLLNNLAKSQTFTLRS